MLTNALPQEVCEGMHEELQAAVSWQHVLLCGVLPEVRLFKVEYSVGIKVFKIVSFSLCLLQKLHQSRKKILLKHSLTPLSLLTGARILVLRTDESH